MNSNLRFHGRVHPFVGSLLTLMAIAVVATAGCSSNSAAAPAAGANSVDCSPYANCGTCMPVTGCGWCGVAPGGSDAAGFCSSSPVGCATTFYANGCPSSYTSSSGAGGSSGAGSSGSGTSGGIAGTTNQPVTCNMSSSAQETPGQYGGCACSIGTECIGTTGPARYQAGYSYIGCSTGGTCCGPQGHPEISCPAGYACTTAGTCVPGGATSGSSSGPSSSGGGPNCNVPQGSFCPTLCTSGCGAGTSSGSSGSTSGGTSSSSSGSSGSTSSSGSSGGTSATCHSMTSCVQVNTHSPGSNCNTGIGYDLIDNCGQTVYCRVCAVLNGVIDDNACDAFTFNGSDIGQTFCPTAYTNVRFVCMLPSDDPSCTRTF